MGYLPKVARVLLDLSLDRSFDYAIPPQMAPHLHIGMRVMVPFGKGAERPAYIVGFAETSTYGELKNIRGISKDNASLPDHLIHLGEWMAQYYCCARETAIRNLLPGAVRSGKVRHKTQTLYYLSDRDSVQKYILENPRAKARIALLKVLPLCLPKPPPQEAP